jgi:hypothetical protein
MARYPGFFDAERRLEALSVAGDPLVRLAEVVDFELPGRAGGGAGALGPRQGRRRPENWTRRAPGRSTATVAGR